MSAIAGSLMWIIIVVILVIVVIVVLRFLFNVLPLEYFWTSLQHQSASVVSIYRIS